MQYIEIFLSPVNDIIEDLTLSDNVLLNLLNELKRDKIQGLPSILSLFHNKFNKFNNTGVLM